MGLSQECRACLLKRQQERVKGVDSSTRAAYLREVEECIHASVAEDTAPVVIEKLISKGQGNFETLNHCGMNVFYLFLCKCDWFVKQFGMTRLEGVFIRDCELR